jgi:hypothetical protein
MQAKRWLTLSSLAAVLALSLCSSGQAIALGGNPLGSEADLAIQSTTALGWQETQLPSSSQGGQPSSLDPDLAIRATTAVTWAVSQLSALQNGAASVYVTSAQQTWAADDFFIPNLVIPGSIVVGAVRKVTVMAYGNSISVSGKTINVYFYGNAGGNLPSIYPSSVALGLTPYPWDAGGLASGDFYVNTAAYLWPNRSYWVSVQVNTTADGWFWAESGTHGFDSAWKGNRDNDAPCKDAWGLRVATCGKPPIDSKGPDLAFKVEGDYIEFTNQLFLPSIAR